MMTTTQRPLFAALTALALAAAVPAGAVTPGSHAPLDGPRPMPRPDGSGGSDGGELRPMPRPVFRIERPDGSAFWSNTVPSTGIYGFYDPGVERMRWFSTPAQSDAERKEAIEKQRERLDRAKLRINVVNPSKRALARVREQRRALRDLRENGSRNTPDSRSYRDWEGGGSTDGGGSNDPSR